MPNHFTYLDWLVLAIYFAGTMSIGFFFWRRSRSSDEFTAAGRSLPGWVCGLSIFATFLSSISFLALPGAAFAGNWNGFVFSLSLPIATVVAVYWFLPYYRQSGEVSAYAHLEKRFGPWARFYAGTCYLLTQIARMGMVLYLMALPVSTLLGWDIRTVIIIVGVCVTVYAFVGGIVAVIWNDAIQALVLIGGALACIPIILWGMPEGPRQMLSIASADDKFSLGGFDLSFTSQTFWVVMVYGVVINLNNFGIDQNYVQRYIASRSNAEARKSVWLGGLLYVPVSALLFFIGTALYSHYQAHPADLAEVRHAVAVQQLTQKGVAPERADYAAHLEKTQATLAPNQVGDAVFPHFIGKHLPMGVTGLVIAGVLAAGMSTVSTSLNSSATLLMSDWYKRLIAPQARDSQQMLVLHGSTVVLGVVGTLVALVLVRYTDSALDMWWMLSGVFSGGMVGLFLLGLIARRAGNMAGIVGVSVGILVIAWMSLSPTELWPDAWQAWRNPLHKHMVIVVGTLTILLVGLAYSSLTRGRVNVQPTVVAGERRGSENR